MALSKSELARYLSSASLANRIVARPAGCVVPLSLGQEQIWLHGLLEPSLPLYNETVTLTYRGLLRADLVERCLGEIVCRHEIWRTNVRVVDGMPRQVVREAGAAGFAFEQVDLSGPEGAERDGAELERVEQAVERLAAEFARRPFDLAQGWLLRALVVKVAERDWRIFLTLHHMIFDGVSIRQVFLPELIALYEAGVRGEEAQLATPELQYGDYACWQRGQGAAGESLEYWKRQLRELPVLALPTDRPRTPGTSHRGAIHSFSFGARLTGALRRLGQQQGTTLFHVMLASFTVLLARYTGEREIVLGTIDAGRTHLELESMLGYFLNTVVLRVDLSGDPDFLEVLERVREVVVSALAHAEAPYQEVVRALGGARDGRDGLVQAVFSFQPPLSGLPSEWGMDAFHVGNGTAKFDLHLELEEKPEGLVGRAIYNTDLFDAATVEGLTGHWFALLESVLLEPLLPCWALPMLGAAEREWLVEGLNGTRRAYPEISLPELICRQAAATPDRVAAGCGGRVLSYRELDEAASELAGRLAGLGVGAGPGSKSVVALLLPRGLEMLVGLLGILKAGAAYVPLDPVYPPGRLAAMLRASGAELLITEPSLRGSLPAEHPRLLELELGVGGDAVSGLVAGPETAVPRDTAVPLNPAPPLDTAVPRDTAVPLESPAYLIFTSGSTGDPKGVEVSHRALTNLLWSMQREPGLGPGDTLLAVTSICFDIAALELFLPLIAGGRVEIATSDEVADPRRLLALLARSGATVMQATPVTWRMLIEAGWAGGGSLKVLCGGEALGQKLAAGLLERAAEVWNMYGPTETTIWSACCRVTDGSEAPPLGSPIANTSLVVLDEHQQLTPVGVAGELYIGGDGLALGYWRNPEATSEKFPVVDVDGRGPQRLYRTGDRVVRRRDGSLSFLGRVDKQIKLRGFRIELGDVEQAVRRLEGVADAVAVKAGGGGAGADQDQDEVLVAYLIPAPGAELDLGRLRQELEPLLPVFMRPSILMQLDRAPLTPNGKLDRKRLPDPFAVRDAGGAGEPAESWTEQEAPLGGIEQTLAAIWCDLLHLGKIGRHEDFFALGGHSLLAVRLVARVESVFGQRVTLASLVHAPTVAQMARVLEGEAPPPAMLLKPGLSGGKRLFWVGAAPWLRSLAAYLSEDQALYTVTIGPERLPLFAPGYRMADMAAWLVPVVRELQAEGPYLIGGFCMDAILAYEIAQQLEEQGQEVELLVMGDVFAPGSASRSSHRGIKMQLQRELGQLMQLLRASPLAWPQECARLVRARLGGWRQRQEYREWRRMGAEGAAACKVPGELLQALFMAEARYAVKPYGGRVLFLEAAGTPHMPQLSTSASWDGLMEELEVFTYPGEHMDLQTEPCLGLAAAKIRAAIKSSREVEASSSLLASTWTQSLA